MKIDGEYTFAGSREKVWDLLQDPEVLAKALPGAQKMEKTEDDVYLASMKLKVGPMTGVFSGKVVLRDKVEFEKYTMDVEGKGGPGFAKGTVLVELESTEEGHTLMKYKSEINVGGRLASVGQRLLDTVGKSISKQSLEAMNKELQARLNPDAEEDPEESSGMTEAEFAKNVMKDVVSETFFSPSFLIGSTLLVAIVAAVIYYFTR